MNKLFLFYFYLFLFLCIKFNASELCPPFFGDFECPIDYNCSFGVCKNEIEQSPPLNCAEVKKMHFIYV